MLCCSHVGVVVASFHHFGSDGNTSSNMNEMTWNLMFVTLISIFLFSKWKRSQHTHFCRYGVRPGPDAGRLPLQSCLPWTLQHVPEVHASKTHPPWPPPLLQGRSSGPQLRVPVQALIITPAQTHVHVYQRSSRLCRRPCSKLSDWARLTTSLAWPECSSGLGRWGFICRQRRYCSP